MFFYKNIVLITEIDGFFDTLIFIFKVLMITTIVKKSIDKKKGYIIMELSVKKGISFFSTDIAVFFMFMYNFLRIISFSTIKEVFDLSNIVIIAQLGLLLSVIPFLLFARYRWNLFFIVLSCIGIFISQFDGVTNYLTMIVVMVSLANHDITKFIKALYYSVIFGVMCILMMRFIGFIPDRVSISPRGITRYAFGFGTTRGLSEMYLTFCKLFVYLNFERLKSWWLCLLAVPIIPINFYTDSRATLFLGFLFLLLVYILKKNKNKFTLILYIGTLLSLIISSVTIFLGSLMYKYSPLWIKLDSFVSDRFQFGHWFLINFPVKLLGQPLPIGVDKETLLTQYNTDYLMLDSGYMTMLLEGGVIITLIMVVIILVAFKKMKNKRNNIGLLVWLISSLDLFQTRLLNPASLEGLLLAQAFELKLKKIK